MGSSVLVFLKLNRVKRGLKSPPDRLTTKPLDRPTAGGIWRNMVAAEVNDQPGYCQRGEREEIAGRRLLSIFPFRSE